MIECSGTGNATEVMKGIEGCTIDCSGGEQGRVLDGILEYEVQGKE